MSKQIIQTPDAPTAIGTYSQAVRVNDTVYLSGQIGLAPESMQMVDVFAILCHQPFAWIQELIHANG